MPPSDSAGLEWIKSRSSLPEGECVEVAKDGDTVLIRNSREPRGNILRYTAAEMRAFIEGAKNGEFDRVCQ